MDLALAVKQLPPTARQLADRVTDLETVTKFLRSSRDRVGRASIDIGADFIVRGLLSVVGKLTLTGDLEMRSGLGDLLFRLGDMVNGDRGIQFLREDGSLAFELRKIFPSDDEQALSFYDAGGRPLLAEFQYFGGLKAPLLEHPFQPVGPGGTAFTCGPYGVERAHPPAVATGTWATLFVYDGKRQNAFLDLKAAAICSDSTTAGELRVVNMVTGLQLPGFFDPAWTGVIPAGTTSLLVLDPTAASVGINAAGSVGGQMRVGLQCRRTAGTGTITVSIPQAIGADPCSTPSRFLPP